MKASQSSSDSIQKLFDGIAPQYDVFNRLTSFGMDKRWRRKALEPLQPGMRVLDLGCGTGDLCLEASKKLKDKGEVIGLDFSEEMLRVAERRYRESGSPLNGRFRLVQKKAEDLPFEDEGYDLVVSGFVLRNLYGKIDEVLGGVFRSLRSGGEIRFLDFTEPRSRLWLALWRAYMNAAAFVYGKFLFGKDFPYAYLTESARRFPKTEEMTLRLLSKGFREVSAQKFMGGIIVLYKGKK